MAAVFTFVTLVVGTVVVTAVVLYVSNARTGSWWRNRYLPVVVVFGVLALYLVVKIAYEEIYPCVAVDSFYCDFNSTQYHNLFGWEF